MAYIPLGNPIWSSQFRLQGGSRLFFKAGAYGFCIVGLIVLYHYLDTPRRPFSATALGALRLLAWAQVVVVVLGGAAAITRALTRDHTTRMIESYRMSPMSSSTVVVGYLLGSPLQILLLYGVGLVIGLFLSVIGKIGTNDWLVGNIYLLVVSASIWSIVLCAGVGSGKPGNVAALIVVGALLSPAIMAVVPGLGLFIGAYAVGQCQRSMLGRIGHANGLGVALAVAVLMLVFWCAAAARRYRKPYLPPLSVVASLVLVACWLLVFLVGMVAHDELVPGGGLAAELMSEGPGIVLALVITLLGPLLVVHLPAAAAARMRRRHIMGAESHLRSDRWSPALATGLSVLLVLAMIVVLFGIDGSDGSEGWRSHGLGVRAWGAVAVALVLAGWTVTGFLRLSQFTIGRTVIASILIVLVWIVPPVVDHMRVSLFHGAQFRIEGYSFLLGCSPILSIITACTCPTYTLWPGLVCQAVVALFAHLMGNRAEYILIRRRARMRVQESQTVAAPSP